jgi:hypothetical protein
MQTGETQQGSEKPDLLWHYTDGNGLLGILDTSSIWASGINFLNDASENGKARQLLKQSVNARIEKSAGSDREWLRQLLSSNVWDYTADLFVACFSASRDSLSQWRAYTTVGGSYAIGFDKDALMGLGINPEEPQAHGFVRKTFRKVQYYSKAVHDPMFGDKADELIASFMKEDPFTEVQLSGYLTDFSPFFKDESFKEEEEWRLVCRGMLDYIDVKYRTGRSHLIPYLIIPFPNEPIREIMVGPGPNSDLDVQALETFKRATHHAFAVSKSKTPFRNW